MWISPFFSANKANLSGDKSGIILPAAKMPNHYGHLHVNRGIS
jgi:hypothetical protein